MKIRLIHVLMACVLPLTASGQQDTLVDLEPGYRRVLLEEYTGMQCSFCPEGHKIANEIKEAYPEDCFLVNIHATSLAAPYPGGVDLRSDYGEDLAERFLNGSGLPSGVVSRHAFASGLVLGRESWFDASEEILGMDTYVNVGAKAVVDWASRKLRVEVQLYYTGDSPSVENYVHVALLQNNVEAMQLGSESNPSQVLENGQYLHQHVLRDLLTGLDGDAVSETRQGSFVARTYEKILPEQIRGLDLDLMQLQVVVFVTENLQEVMNVCEAPVTFESGADYVFELNSFEQLPQNTCDNRVRLAFDVVNRNGEDKLVESLAFRFTTLSGQTHDYECAVPDFASQSRIRIETDGIPADKIGQADTLFVQVVAVNGQVMEVLQDSVQVEVFKDYYILPEPEVVLDIWQDRWGSETSWSFVAEDGTVLEEVEAYPDLSGDGVEKHTYDLSLVEGCNVFIIKDAMKDGINNGDGAGHLQLSDADGDLVVAHDGTYADSLVWLFRYQPGVDNEVSGFVSALRLLPNPASESAFLEVESLVAGFLEISLWGMDGRKALDLGSQSCIQGMNRIELPLHRLESGVYVVRLQQNGQVNTAKLIVR